MPIELPEPHQVQKRSFKRLAIIAGVSLVAAGSLSYAISAIWPSRTVSELRCHQPPLIQPDFAALSLHNSSIFQDDEYRKRSIALLSGAVQIPTIVYDDMSMDVEKDPRFKVFLELHDYFAKHFPHLTKYVEKVNTYGLLYTLPGSDPKLKPLVLTAHQDVVPVDPDTLDKWQKDPFGGEFDGTWIHGRGTCDTKNTLVAIHEAVEALLEQKWSPKRTLILSFGFDEESQGWRGARKLSTLLEERYGQDSIEMLVDEGLGITEQYGAYFATPAVAEKGRINFRMTLKTPGGHSSIPPDHTGIGIMANLVTQLESDIPLQAGFAQNDVVRSMFACIGKHGDDLPKKLGKIYRGLGRPKYDSQLVNILASDISTRELVETTQAIDIIHGGVKINALPEQVVMEVNYRVKPSSSLDEEKKRVLQFVKDNANRFNLAVNVSNPFSAPQDAPEAIIPASAGQNGFMLVETTDLLEVAPVAPFENDSHWNLLSGTTKHVIEYSSQDFDNLPLIMAPGLMTGNTDTSHYWNLTTNLYRFFPALMSDVRNIHTVNESLKPRSHIAAVTFFYELLVNADKELE